MKKIMTLLLVLAFNYFAFAQLENNNWYFGQNNAINFDTSTPTIQTGSAMQALETCASVSDEVGNLLFYTNGVNVWNKDHQLMPNGTGLLGHISSAQTIIVPDVQHSKKYYLFTSNGFSGDELGFHYSVIDMNLDGGNGDIVSGEKNMTLHNINGSPLGGTESEIITSYYNSDSNTIWVVLFYNNEFLSYEISACNGFNNQAVSSTHYHPGLFLGLKIQMKIAPNGTRLAISTLTNVNVFDFNQTNGEVSLTFETIDFGAYGAFIYGLEFSPNSQYLYMYSAGTSGILATSRIGKPKKEKEQEKYINPKSKIASIYQANIDKNMASPLSFNTILSIKHVIKYI